MKASTYYSRLEDRSQDWSAQARDPGFAPFKKVIDSSITSLKAGGRILDIGCQGGHHLALLRDNYDECFGVDIARYDDLWSSGAPTIFIEHDVDLQPLPFPDGHFSCILCMNVMEHVFDVFGLANEISRLLEPSGTCLIMVPNAAHVRHIISLLYGEVPRTGATQHPFLEVDGWDGQHLHLFTCKELTWLLNSRGISVTAQHFTGKAQLLKRIFPSQLSADIVLVGTKEVICAM